MSRTSGGRGLILAALALLFLTAVVDLLRPESFLLGLFRGDTPQQTPIERAVKDFTDERRAPVPRTNRVEGRGTRTVMPEARPPLQA